MKLSPIKGKGTDRWTVHVAGQADEGNEENFELLTRGQVYAFIRAARMLGVKDERLTISRTLEAEYGFSGE